MTETNSQPESRDDSQAGETPELHERAERLREKVGDLSKTFERIERSLAEAGEEQRDPNA